MNINNVINFLKGRFFLLFTLAGIVFAVLLIVFLIFIFPLQKTTETKPSPTPIPVPTDFNVDYSRLNRVIPGKSTFKDVEKINGAPFSKQVFGEKTTFYYKTPSEDYQNTVVFKNGVASYVVENIFGNYRGYYNNYLKNFGPPDIALYQEGYDSDYPWYIFLQKGVAIRSGNNKIVAFLYFIPQDRYTFLTTIGKEMLLSLTPTPPVVDTIPGL